VQISVVRPGELGPSEIATWHSMQRQTGSLASPFLCPEFAIAVGSLRPGARVAVLAEGPTIVGFFPFERRRLRIGVPIGAGMTDCQGLIHSPGLEWDARGLLRACGMSVWQFDHLVEGQRPFQRYAMAVAPSGRSLRNSAGNWLARLANSSEMPVRSVSLWIHATRWDWPR
jgi:CelD/BcsL family acetyltransferase involved in cellulose biosynthesis